MTTVIVEKLKTGPIKNVIGYGSGSLPSPPYVVVRPEQNPQGRLFRIFTHMRPGQQIFLENYVFGTLQTLLEDYATEDRNGNYNQLLLEADYGDIVTQNDDGTISMERRFLVPQVFSILA